MPGQHLYAHNDAGSDVLLFDVDDGSTVDSFNTGGTITSTLVDLKGNIYVGFDGPGEIAKFDENYNEQWRWSNGYDQVSKLFMWPDRGHIYVGEDGRFHALDRDTGDHLYTTYAPNEEVMDFTRDEEYIHTVSYGDGVIHRCDPDTGDEIDTWAPTGQDLAGVLYYNGNWYISDDSSTAFSKYDGWKGVEEAYNTESPNAHASNLVVDDNDGTIFTGTDNAEIVAFDTDPLGKKWETNLGSSASNPDITSLSVTPSGRVFANERDEESTYGLNTDGDILWDRQDVGFFIWQSFSAYPQYDIYANDDWYGSIELSGMVTKHDDPVEGAEILVIDDTEEEFVTRVVSDANGNWSADAPDSTLHVVTQYEDEDGTQYHDVSYPFITEGDK